LKDKGNRVIGESKFAVSDEFTGPQEVVLKASCLMRYSSYEEADVTMQEPFKFMRHIIKNIHDEIKR
jgi:hypothetical protein